MSSLGFRVALVLSCLVLLSCGNSPTEPMQAQPQQGNVVITVSQPCALPGSLEFSLQGRPTTVVAVPGETRLSAPAGRYTFSFRRGDEVFGRAGSAGSIDIVAGGTTTLADPPEACMATSPAQ
jgi:hypothetical protein